MDMETLTEQEIELLLEGLDCLPMQGVAAEMMMSMVDSMAAHGDEEKIKVATEKIGRQDADRQARNKARDGAIMILKAKMVLLRDKATVARAEAEATG